MKKEQRIAKQKERELSFHKKATSLKLKDLNLKLFLRGKSLFQKAKAFGYAVHEASLGNRLERRKMFKNATHRGRLSAELAKL